MEQRADPGQAGSLPDPGRERALCGHGIREGSAGDRGQRQARDDLRYVPPVGAVRRVAADLLGGCGPAEEGHGDPADRGRACVKGAVREIPRFFYQRRVACLRELVHGDVWRRQCQSVRGDLYPAAASQGQLSLARDVGFGLLGGGTGACERGACRHVRRCHGNVAPRAAVPRGSGVAADLSAVRHGQHLELCVKQGGDHGILEGWDPAQQAV